MRAGCQHIESRDRGGGFLPPPRLPLPPWGCLPRSSYGDTPRVRPFPGYRHDCPRPSRGGGGGQRPGGVGDADILRAEILGGWSSGFSGAPLPGVGDVGILKAETGEGAFCPLPVCPTPRGDASHGPVYGASLKRELAQGFALPGTAFPRVSPRLPPPLPGRGRRPEAGRGGGCEHIGSRDRGGGFCPLPVCPIPVGIPPTVQCNGKSLREELVCGWGIPACWKQRQGRGLSAPSPSAPPPWRYPPRSSVMGRV